VTGRLSIAVRPGLPPITRSEIWPRFSEMTRAPGMLMTLADTNTPVELI
jgi:hypothetical protein